MAKGSKRTRNVRLKKKMGGSCWWCGYSRNFAALDFHHLDPAEKTSGLNTSAVLSNAKREAEAEKCVLLCRNCHAEIHNPQLDADAFLYMDG